MNANGHKRNGLTPRQARFVQEYVIDLNGTQAAIRAGFSPKGADVTASRLLGNAKVEAALHRAMTRIQERTEITQERVVKGILEATLHCAEKIPTKLGPRMAEPFGVFKGYELLGKHLKMFTDKVEHSGNVSNLSDEDLEARITSSLAEMGAGKA